MRTRTLTLRFARAILAVCMVGTMGFVFVSGFMILLGMVNPLLMLLAIAANLYVFVQARKTWRVAGERLAI